MISLFTNAVLLSLDSLIATLALGPVLQSPARRWLLAASFGFCDAAAVWVGYHFGWGSPAGEFGHWAAPLFILAYGICCLCAANWQGFRADPRLVFILPLLMSLDNLAYGATSGVPDGNVVAVVAVFGLVSFALAALGLLPGSLIRFRDQRKRLYWAGAAMLAASGLLFVS